MDTNSFFSYSCRICSLDYQNGINVFGDEGKRLYLQAKIRKYLCITVSVEDMLPKMICENCCKQLDDTHKFATMAIKNQDKFNKIIASSSFFIDVPEPTTMEPNGLLLSCVTKEKDSNVYQQDNEVTEMEIRVDPMLVLQYALDDDEYLCETESETDSQAIQKKSKASKNNTDEPESNAKPYFCLTCTKQFASESALQSHLWCHYSKATRIILTNYDNPICDLGEKAAEKNTTAKVNSRQASRANYAKRGSAARFICPLCGKIISTKGNLKVHLETHRPKGKYNCDICGRIFKTQCNLHRHKEYHEGIQFPCTVCGRVYPTNSTLKAHSITHSDLRPHKCPLCEKTFKRNQDLKFHINQHTGARPYQCPYCPKAFASSGNCFSHRKRMHPLEVERDRERAAKIIR